MDLLTVIDIPDFPSLKLTVIELDSPYYPLTPLSKILGYKSPNSLIQSIPPELRISIKEFYSLYLLYLDQFQSYTPLTEGGLKEALAQFKPFSFTTIEGLNYILSKNTFTVPRLKQCIAELLGLTVVSPPRKESIFYSTLQSFLDQHNIIIQRHLYLAGYFVDCAVEQFKLIIEYDEFSHKYYSAHTESVRENALRQLGYTILRVEDSIAPERSALQVYLHLVDHFTLKEKIHG